LLFQAPDVGLELKQREAFNDLLKALLSQNDIPGATTERISDPASFLMCLAGLEWFLFHGTNQDAITTLNPKQHMDYLGSPLQAVFATLDAKAYCGFLRNAWFTIG